MKKFEFRLAPVLRLRRTNEEIAKSQLAVANIALREAIAFRDAERARAIASTPESGTASYFDFHAAALSSTLSAQSHAVAQAKVAQAAAAAAMAQIAWAGAAREVAVLERLAERRLAEYQVEQGRADAAALDDIVNARYAFDQSRHVPGALV